MWREIAHSCLLCHSQALAEQPYHRRNQTLMNGTFMTMAARMQLTGRAVATRAAAETGSTLPATPRPFGDPQHHLGELANGGGNPPSVVALPPYTRAGRIAHPNSPKTAPAPLPDRPTRVASSPPRPQRSRTQRCPNRTPRQQLSPWRRSSRIVRAFAPRPSRWSSGVTVRGAANPTASRARNAGKVRGSYGRMSVQAAFRLYCMTAATWADSSGGPFLLWARASRRLRAALQALFSHSLHGRWRMHQVPPRTPR
jgi:hypothetical protein